MALATQQQIDDFFNHWELYQADIERVLNATDSNGSGSNFSSAILVLSSVEQFAKLYSPTVNLGNNRGHREAIIRGSNVDSLQKVDAKHAVKLFFRKYMSPTDSRYGIYGPWIWDVFRNGLTHLFFPKKIINVPMTEIQNSFLTGVHWPGKLTDLQSNAGLMSAARSENMSFYIAGYSSTNIPRPVFRVVPHIFYLDLLQAAQQFKHDVENIPHRKRLFSKGLMLLDKARRKPFTNTDLPTSTKNQALAEIRNLI